jgi:hypothetical protein
VLIDDDPADARPPPLADVTLSDSDGSSRVSVSGEIDVSSAGERRAGSPRLLRITGADDVLDLEIVEPPAPEGSAG